jgi:hypothetical protein
VDFAINTPQRSVAGQEYPYDLDLSRARLVCCGRVRPLHCLRGVPAFTSGMCARDAFEAALLQVRWRWASYPRRVSFSDGADWSSTTTVSLVVCYLKRESFASEFGCEYTIRGFVLHAPLPVVSAQLKIKHYYAADLAASGFNLKIDTGEDRSFFLATFH